MTTPNWPSPNYGHFEIRNFGFLNGETLPNLKLHYATLGQPRYDNSGKCLNAALVLHGTGGSCEQFLTGAFAGHLFNRGQTLDAEKHFIVIRDGIGHGKSSRPSDGLKADFPRYGYRDMVRADRALLTEGLGVNHLRLVMGTSMGGMQSWLWAGMFPNFIDAAMPLASLPTQISGRNRMFRKMIMDAIETDPEYLGGNYESQPKHGLTSALYVLTFMSSVPLQWQKEAPDRESADRFLDNRIKKAISSTDANDLLYQIRASEDYDPRPLLSDITVPLMAVNTADDAVNPPELGILESGIEKVVRGRAVVLPISDALRGHGSHTIASLWKPYLDELMRDSATTG